MIEFGLKGTSRVCRGRHGEVGIVEFGLQSLQPASTEIHSISFKVLYTLCTVVVFCHKPIISVGRHIVFTS